MLPCVLQTFVERSPICVMAHAALENLYLPSIAGAAIWAPSGLNARGILGDISLSTASSCPFRASKTRTVPETSPPLLIDLHAGRRDSRASFLCCPGTPRNAENGVPETVVTSWLPYGHADQVRWRTRQMDDSRWRQVLSMRASNGTLTKVIRNEYRARRFVPDG
jgi:hypothetical protein